MCSLLLGNNAEFFQVVFDPQVFFLEGLLPDDDIEVVSPRRACDRRQGRSGRLEDKAANRRWAPIRVLKPSGTSAGMPPKVFHSFHPSSGKPEGSPRAAHQDGINGQGIEEIGLDLTEHLKRLDDLYRRARRIRDRAPGASGRLYQRASPSPWLRPGRAECSRVPGAPRRVELAHVSSS